MNKKHIHRTQNIPVAISHIPVNNELKSATPNKRETNYKTSTIIIITIKFETFINTLLSMLAIVEASCVTAGVGKVRPAGQIRPTSSVNPARGSLSVFTTSGLCAPTKHTER